MIATYHRQAFHNQLQSTPWTAEELYDFEVPESAEVKVSDEDSSVGTSSDLLNDRDQILNRVRHLTVSSLSSFQEIASATSHLHLRSFAEVVVRQRTAQQHALYEELGYSVASDDDDATGDAISALRSLWRGAIWSLEQRHHGLFLEYAERAEALLEEAFLEAAQALGDDPLASEIRGYAIMVCGSRALIEELADGISSRVQHDLQDNRGGTDDSQLRSDSSKKPVTYAKQWWTPSSANERPNSAARRAMSTSPSTGAGNKRDWGTHARSSTQTIKARGASRSVDGPAKSGR